MEKALNVMYAKGRLYLEKMTNIDSFFFNEGQDWFVPNR